MVRLAVLGGGRVRHRGHGRHGRARGPGRHRPRWLLVAFLGWQLFWLPAVVVHDAGITLENPFRTIVVPWAALVHVDTRFALTLVTAEKSYTSWAAPAPGIWGGRHARPEDLQGLPATTYGPGKSVRPGDLKTTDSGQAAQLVRARWQRPGGKRPLAAGDAADTAGDRDRTAGRRPAPSCSCWRPATGRSPPARPATPGTCAVRASYSPLGRSVNAVTGVAAGAGLPRCPGPSWR